MNFGQIFRKITTNILDVVMVLWEFIGVKAKVYLLHLLACISLIFTNI